MHISLQAPRYEALLHGLDSGRLAEILGTDLRASPGAAGYPHWDTLIHLAPPGDLTHKERWLGVKVLRQAATAMSSRA